MSAFAWWASGVACVPGAAGRRSLFPLGGRRTGMLRRDIRKELGALVRRLREERGLGPAQLGDRSGLTEMEVLLIENGRKAIRFEDLVCLARGLGITPAAFFEGP